MRQRVSERRFSHILRVAQLADEIARANHFSERELHITSQAAILHDVARELSPQDMFRLAPPETELERNFPMTLHGRAGRKIAESWDVTNKQILDAIEGHVFGVEHDNRPGMAVYIADVSEPARGVNQDIRELAMTDLFSAYQRAVDSKVRYLQSKGKAVHPITLKVHRALCSVA